MLAVINRHDYKFRVLTAVFWTQCSLEWTTDTIRNFESLLPHSEPFARWNHSAFWTLCWLEPTTNTIRKLASSLPYSTMLAETDKSDPVVEMRILNFLTPEPLNSLLAGNVELCSLEPTRNPIKNFASSLPYSELSARWNVQPIWSEIPKFTATFRILLSLEPFRILNFLQDRINYKYLQIRS